MATDAVLKATEALLIDAERYGGTLSLEQVERVLDRRGLRPSECVEVFQALTARDVISAPKDDSELPIVGSPTITEQDEAAEQEKQSLDTDNKLPTQQPFPTDAFEIDVQALNLENLRSHQLLSAQDERELGRAIRISQSVLRSLENGEFERTEEVTSVIRRGDQARIKMTLSNLRLVMKSAYRYSTMCDLPLDDLFQEGVIGLLKAVEKYDHSLGYKFSTYATWWIMQAITRYIADCGATIRLPVHMHEKVLRIKRAIRVLTKFTGKPPTLQQLAEEIDAEPESVQFLLDISQRQMVELHRPLSEGSNVTIGDMLPTSEEGPETLVSDLDARKTIMDVLNSLTAREKVIITRRFGLDYDKEFTLQELGDEFKLTRERIRQIEANALRKLRHPTRSRILADILGDGEQEKEDKLDS